MIFRTEVRDCLCLNWALPAALLPPPPAPLRYEVQTWDGKAVVFASALLFRQEGPRMPGVPIPPVDAPQFQLHLCTIDGNGVPSVLIRALLAPSWLAPGVRLVTRQPTRSAKLVFPTSLSEGTEWRWEVRRGKRLIVSGSIGAPLRSSGPDLGTWEETVAYFRRRSLGFSECSRGLRRVEIERARTAVTPIRATIEDDALLLGFLAEGDVAALPPLHSAWLCAPMAINYELSAAERASVGSEVPAPG